VLLERLAPLLDVFAPSGRRWDPSGLTAFRFLLLVHAAVRLWGRVAFEPVVDGPPLAVVLAAVATVAAAASLVAGQARRAAGVMTTVTLLEVITNLPDTPNHVYLELYCLGLFAVLDTDSKAEGPLLRSALCWMAILVLFHSGLQKVIYGYYFRGDFLLTVIAGRERFAWPFVWLLPAGEVERLRQFEAFLTGAGPFRSDSILLLVVSNGVWVAEIVLPVLIVVGRSRAMAVGLAIALVVGFQVLAREFVFALLFAQLLLVALPGEWNRRTVPLFLIAYAILILGILGILPSDLVTREGQM
jgi:hypothetical protein